MNALAQDIRRICLELLPSCQPAGWGNVAYLRGFCIHVSPVGVLNSWIQVAVTLKGAPSGTPVSFFRELSRDGTERDETGAQRHNGLPTEAWLRQAIQHALAWVEINGTEKPEPPPGPMDFLFQD